MALALVTLASSAAPADRFNESIAAAAVRIGSELAARRPVAAQAGADNAWNGVRRLREGTRIRVKLRNGDVADGRLSHVTDDRIVLRPGSAGSNTNLTGIPRDTIAEVRRRTPGAWIGGLVGLGVGGVVGVGSAVSLATRQCGESCNDEKALIAVSLVGMPAAGAALGATLGSRLGWATVYRRP